MTRCGQLQVLAVDDGERDLRPVGRGGPLPVGACSATESKSPSTGSCLSSVSSRSSSVICSTLEGVTSDVRPKRSAVRVGLGVGARPGRRRALDGRDDPARLEEVAGERSRRLGEREDADLGLGLGALAQDQGAARRRRRPRPARRAGAAPPPASRRRRQRDVGSGQDAEVLGVLVGQHDEPAVPPPDAGVRWSTAYSIPRAAADHHGGLGQRRRPRGRPATRWCWCCAAR